MRLAIITFFDFTDRSPYNGVNKNIIFEQQTVIPFYNEPFVVFPSNFDDRRYL